MSSIATTLEKAPPSFFEFYPLAELNNPEYDPRQSPPEKIFDKSRRLTRAGFTHTLEVASYLGKRLTKFRDAFLKGGNKSKYVQEETSELHNLIDQAEDVRARLISSSVPMVKYIIDNELSSWGIEKVLKAGHSLTNLAEHCALEAIKQIDEFDPRKTAKDYYEFLSGKVQSMLKVDEPKNEEELTWRDFERMLKNQTSREKSQIIDSLLGKVSERQSVILSRLYGLDGRPPETSAELAIRMSKPKDRIDHARMKALTVIGIAIDPLGFTVEYYPDSSRKDLERKNRALWRHLRENDLIVPQLRRNYGENPIKIYSKKYPNISRGKLPYIDNPLYQALKYRNQLHLVRTQKELESNSSNHLLLT